MADIPESTKMLPCPFCGSSSAPYVHPTRVENWFGVTCDDERAGCGACIIADGRDQAIAAWNTRAAPPAMDREAVYRQALEDVCNPLGYLQRMAEAEGAKLSGMAYAIASDVGTIQRIAKDALSAVAHSDDIAVDRFAALMKAKLAAARAKGRGGWDDPDQCSTDYLRQLLHEHVAKGDPVDVANFCMMLAHYGASTALSADAMRQGEGWQDMGSAPKHDGAKIIGYDAKWGVAEMMLDGAKRWVLAAFNGQVIYCNPLKWQPMPATPASHASDGGKA